MIVKNNSTCLASMLVCDRLDARFPLMTSAKLHWSVVGWNVCMAVFHLIALAAHPHRVHLILQHPLKPTCLHTKVSNNHPSIAAILVAILLLSGAH